jgi:two-component system alkaline phosphatase synthesis response regulator PhoP
MNGGRLESGPRVLIVDDEPNIVKTLRAYLETEQYTVYSVSRGDETLPALRKFQPDVIILDVMLPGLDGIEVLRQLRHESSAYVLMLSARGDETDRLLGLRMGADDYVVKPFSPREVLARVATLLRRDRGGDSGGGRGDVLGFPRLVIDPGRRLVHKDGELVDLTPTEFDLLYALAANRGRVMSRDQLIDRAWGNDYFIDERVVDVHIRRLRRKIEDDPADSRTVVTVRGAGYRFEEGHA